MNTMKHFCVKWGYKNVTEQVEQEIGVREWYSVSLQLFNVFIEDFCIY